MARKHYIIPVGALMASTILDYLRLQFYGTQILFSKEHRCIPQMK